MAPLSVFLRNRSSVLFKHRVSSQKVDEITIIANLLFGLKQEEFLRASKRSENEGMFIKL